MSRLARKKRTDINIDISNGDTFFDLKLMLKYRINQNELIWIFSNLTHEEDVVVFTSVMLDRCTYSEAKDALRLVDSLLKEYYERI